MSQRASWPNRGHEDERQGHSPQAGLTSLPVSSSLVLGAATRWKVQPQRSRNSSCKCCGPGHLQAVGFFEAERFILQQEIASLRERLRALQTQKIALPGWLRGWHVTVKLSCLLEGSRLRWKCGRLFVRPFFLRCGTRLRGHGRSAPISAA